MDNATITKPLTAKQARFVDEYLVDCNGAAAAVRAGYSPGSAKVAASRLLTIDNHPVVVAIRARQREDAVRLSVTRNDVVRGLLAAFEMAKADRNAGAMISAMSTLGKMLGFYEPETKRVELGGDGARLRMKFEALSDEELLAIACGQAAVSH